MDLTGMRGFTFDGTPLTPGVNVDAVDYDAGLTMARQVGYCRDGNEIMLVTYALQRHARGEETGAERTALGGGIDFTSWRMILAAAVSAARGDAA